MTQDTFGLPQNVYDAFFRCAKRWVGTHYVGKKFELKPIDSLACANTNNHFLSCYSWDVSEKHESAKGRRFLRKLVKEGLLAEREKSYAGQAVCFKLANPKHVEKIIKHAHDYYKSLGYVEGVVMERKH